MVIHVHMCRPPLTEEAALTDEPSDCSSATGSETDSDSESEPVEPQRSVRRRLSPGRYADPSDKDDYSSDEDYP